MKDILVINPGSTGTKVAVYGDSRILYEKTLEHDLSELHAHPSPRDQADFRKTSLLNWLTEMTYPRERFRAIAARGGVIGELETGAYLVDMALMEASLHSSTPHASNLAAVIAYDLSVLWGIPAYIYDAVCGMGKPDPMYTLSGLQEIPRPFVTHVLNSRAVAYHHAAIQGKNPMEQNVIVVHMGGGITTNLIHQGKILDFVGDDEGTFSPERSGRVPCRGLVRLAYTGRYQQKELQTLLKGRGGLVDYLGTNDFRLVEQMAYEQQNTLALQVIQAMALQIAKDIGAMSTVVSGQIHAILLTGGLAYSQRLCSLVQERVSFLAEVHRYPGSLETEALAMGVLRVLRGDELAHQYHSSQSNR